MPRRASGLPISFPSLLFLGLSRRRRRLRCKRDNHERRGADPADDDGQGEDDHHRGGAGSGKSADIHVTHVQA